MKSCLKLREILSFSLPSPLRSDFRLARKKYCPTFALGRTLSPNSSNKSCLIFWFSWGESPTLVASLPTCSGWRCKHYGLGSWFGCWHFVDGFTSGTIIPNGWFKLLGFSNWIQPLNNWESWTHASEEIHSSPCALEERPPRPRTRTACAERTGTLAKCQGRLGGDRGLERVAT